MAKKNELDIPMNGEENVVATSVEEMTETPVVETKKEKKTPIKTVRAKLTCLVKALPMQSARILEFARPGYAFVLAGEPQERWYPVVRANKDYPVGWVHDSTLDI